MQSFSICSRTRPAAMSGIPPLNPIDILDLSERLDWPAEPDECVQVITAMDDAFRDLQSNNSK